MNRRIGKIKRKAQKNILASTTKVNAQCPLEGTVIAIFDGTIENNRSFRGIRGHACAVYCFLVDKPMADLNSLNELGWVPRTV